MDERESLRAGCLPFLPLTAGGVQIGEATLAQLMRFYASFDTRELARMTCRPIKERSMEEREALYAAALKDTGVLTLGVQKGGAFDENEPILGRISVFDFNPRNRSAEFGYVLLPEYRGKGYMKPALRGVCSMLLRDFGLNKVYAQTGAFNDASIALLRTLGFHLDAVLRQHHELEGGLYDDLVFSLLSREL